MQKKKTELKEFDFSIDLIRIIFFYKQVYRRLSERLGLHDESNVLSVFMGKM